MIKIALSENDIKKQVAKYLLVREIPHARINPTRISKGKFYPLKEHEKGIADFIVCYNGRYIELELKRKGGKQSQFQKNREKLVKQNGGHYYLIDDIEQVFQIFK